MFRKILVTLDGSTFAEAALPAAEELARKSGGELRLLAVHDPGWTFDDEETDAVAQSRAARYLSGTQEAIASEIETTAMLRRGHVVDEILQDAEDAQADLVVMATHGRGPVSRFWLGSVADQCVRRANRPVLLVRPPEEDAEAGRWGVRRVVVPLDGSELAEAALTTGLAIADRFGVPIEIVRVVGRLHLPATPFLPEAVAASEELLVEEHKKAEAYLESMAAWLRAWGVEPEQRVVVADRVAPAILARAGGDLVVMSTHARTGVNRAFLGSVADQVVRGASGPVLIVPPDAGARAAAVPSVA